MEVLRAILVDDEINSLQNLQQKIEQFCPAIKIIVTAQQPEEAEHAEMPLHAIATTLVALLLIAFSKFH